MRSVFALVAFLFFVAPGNACALPAETRGGFLVSVYADVNTSPADIPYEQLDGLVLAFINPVDDCGGFAATAFPNVQAIVKGARQQEANGRKIAVTFSIGGGGDEVTNQLLEAIAAREQCRQIFAGQIATILKANDLDGVDLDWEFPQKSSLGNYTLLVQAIRAAIGTKTLSIAIYDDGGNEDPSDHLTPEVFPFIDYYMVMAYLEPRNAAIDSWVDPPWNLPEEQLRLGLAFFGDPDDGGPSAAYKQLLGSVPPAQASPCSDRVGKYAINGLRTTGELTRFAMTENLGGITAWLLSQDRTDSISLLQAASDTARMWDDYDEWQPGTAYAAGTVVQYQGNLWLAQSSGSAPPSLSNPAFKQFEPMAVWSSQNYYCGGDDVWLSGTVYRATRDPALSVTNASPTGAPSLWKKLYAAPAYDGSKTYKKGQRVFFDGTVYISTKKTRAQSPATALTTWMPVVDADAYDGGTAYAAGSTVRYMGNRYTSAKSRTGANPVVATDVWQPVKN